MQLGLPGFARLVQAGPDARLTMAGDGPLKRRWQKLAKQLGFAANVDWLQWQDRDTMAVLYENHDVLLFAAMHDTGGLVALEAMHPGLPVGCLKIGEFGRAAWRVSVCQFGWGSWGRGSLH